MFELRQLDKKTYYIDSPVKIGVYLGNEKDVYLIDSGIDKDIARKIKRILDENNWMLRGILNTHSHADHIGGNSYLQQNTGCKIFSDGIERAFVEYPILEPSFLFGGFPFSELRHKFLLAKESMTVNFFDDDFPAGIEVIPLAGHSFSMTGFRTDDDVVFLADCLSSAAILDKYKITFVYNVAESLATLEKIRTMKAKFFVPSHAEVTDNIESIVSYNINKINETACDILTLCKHPISFEVLLQKLFSKYGLVMNYEQYVLVGSTVRSYLAYLKDNKKLSAMFDNNILLYQALY